jgi:hypothetical protein
VRQDLESLSLKEFRPVFVRKGMKKASVGGGEKRSGEVGVLARKLGRMTIGEEDL